MVQHQILNQSSTAYVIIMLAGILFGALWWSKKFRDEQRLIQIYALGIVCAFAGAKIGYLLAEGWLHLGDPTFWLYLANGKTILGALLGGYAGVEFAKHLTGYRQATGDWFATATPIGIAAGRFGCLIHGCCLGQSCRPAWYTLADQSGIHRWPAPIAEIIFNLTAAAVFYLMRCRQILPGQHFHLYLISYGLFRFSHEFIRDTPRIFGPFTGYQCLSLAIILLGTVGFIRRRRTLKAQRSI